MDENTSALVADLSSPDPLVRERAAIKLEFNLRPIPAVVEPLIALLNDPHNRVQIAAAGALRVMRDERAVVPLLKMFAGDTYLTSEGADSPEQYFRVVRAAATTLGWLAFTGVDSENIFWTLLHRLAWHDADQSPHLRAEAAAAALGLGRIRDLRALSVMVEAAQYGAGRVKDAVILALGELGNLAALPILLDALQTSTSYEIVGNAADSLWFLGNPSVIPALIAIAERDDDRFVIDLPPRQHARMRRVAARFVRLRIGRALAWLANMSDEGVENEITTRFEQWLVRDERSFREAAAVGLAIQSDKRAFDVLMTALQSKDDKNLDVLLSATTLLNDRRAKPILETLIESGHASPRDLEWMRQIVWTL